MRIAAITGPSRGLGLKGLVLLLAASAPTAGWTENQKNEGGVLEEITVTATKREQSVQDVGIAIAAFSTEQLQSMGVRDSTDIAKMTPGVFIGGSIGGQTALFTIRGVTQNDFTDSVESPVAVYVDEGYIAMAQGQSFGTFDLDRVEVSKGPQGTLFGRNATGGLVHYLTRQPTREAEGFVSVTESRYSSHRVEAAFGGPLSSVLAGRISGIWKKQDPILKNTIPANLVNPTLPGSGGGQDEWNDDTVGLRGQLLFTPTDNFDATLSYQWQHTKTSTGPYVSSATVPVYDQQGRLVETYNASPTETRLAIQLDANGQDTGGAVPLGGGLAACRT
ncbi:MAG: TonB-dependent receptor plug domain-containing protein [Steroidobacteraceae bacterium]